MEGEGEEEEMVDLLPASNFQGGSALEVVRASLFISAESRKGVPLLLLGTMILTSKGEIHTLKGKLNIGKSNQLRDASGIFGAERITLKALQLKLL
jgi:hypothetical protein